MKGGRTRGVGGACDVRASPKAAVSHIKEGGGWPQASHKGGGQRPQGAGKLSFFWGGKKHIKKGRGWPQAIHKVGGQRPQGAGNRMGIGIGLNISLVVYVFRVLRY